MHKVLLARENSAKQDCSVNGGNFGFPYSFACVDIGPVIEKSPMVGQLLPQKAHCIQSAGLSFWSRNKLPFLANAKSGQSKACCGNASQFACHRVACVTSILHDSCFRMCLSPKKLKIGFFQFFQKCVVAWG